MSGNGKGENLLEIRDLYVQFHTLRGIVKAIDGVNLEVGHGEVLGLVGETGSGKTVTGLSILRLLEQNAEITGGEIIFQGRDLLKLPLKEILKIRGRDISMIFQEPKAALNPVMQVGDQVAESFLVHEEISKKEARERVLEIFRRVGLPDPGRVYKSYPHELSGGMAQRVVISMALALKPKLLIADEPTSALDVTIQAQIMDLFRELIDEMGTSVIYITHDMALAAEISDRIAVMYAGRIVEVADTETIFENPLHPYTQGLLKSIPKPRYRGKLFSMEGEIPPLINPPSGCRFHPRCPKRFEPCDKEVPKLIEVEPGHKVACFLFGGASK
ncbi:MAG: ABC transporter ATP-binding protein [Candidatus Korarchaeota archaeon]|nr:ABC transporter ATP-binding protein [Candidatus Korarchaeota archaeon]